MFRFFKRRKFTEEPGLYERHLQRRDGNPLFPKSRRCVTNDEIQEARRLDALQQVAFWKQYRVLAQMLSNNHKEWCAAKTCDEGKVGGILALNVMFLMKLIEKAAAIGRSARREIPKLEELEASLLQDFSKRESVLDLGLREAAAASKVLRIAFLAQLAIDDTPILKEESMGGFLSEDLEHIALIGAVLRSLEPSGDMQMKEAIKETVRKKVMEKISFEPSWRDVRLYLSEAVKEGMSKGVAVNIIEAFEGRE